MSQHQQNWERITAELHKAVDQLDGPIEGRKWSDFGGDTRQVFVMRVTEILEAELSHRVGDEIRVNVKIKDALTAIGEQLVRDQASETTTGKGAKDV